MQNRVLISVNDAINLLHNAPNLPTRCRYCGREMAHEHQVYGAGPVCRARVGLLNVLKFNLLVTLGRDVEVTDAQIVPAILPQL